MAANLDWWSDPVGMYGCEDAVLYQYIDQSVRTPKGEGILLAVLCGLCHVRLLADEGTETPVVFVPWKQVEPIQ